MHMHTDKHTHDLYFKKIVLCLPCSIQKNIFNNIHGHVTALSEMVFLKIIIQRLDTMSLKQLLIFFFFCLFPSRH